MIIECPRCGFAQPKDRYCANCGLDIDHFKPVPEPKLKALAQNTFMQIALVVIVVVALASGIYTAQQKAIKKQLAATPVEVQPTAAPVETPPAPPSTDAANRPADAGSPRNALAGRAAKLSATDSRAAEAEVAQENATLGESTTDTPAAGADPAAATGTPGATGAAPKSLSVFFLEMPREVVEQIAAENQILNEYAGTRSIMMASQPGPNSLGTNIVLPGGATRTLEANKKVEMNFMFESQIGMRMEIGHTYHNDQEFDLEVIGQVSLRNALDENTTNTGINGKYTIPKNATLLIVGMVPAQQIRQDDQTYFARTPLAIMASPQFQSRQSQFVVLIQPKQ